MKCLISDMLQIDPKNLYKYIPYIIDDYSYDFLDSLQDYIDINVFYLYLNSLEEHQFKNVWNLLCREWQALKETSQKDLGFKRKYGKDTYDYIHTKMKPLQINKLLYEFAKTDIIKQVFLMRTILYHGYPKLRGSI